MNLLMYLSRAGSHISRSDIKPHITVDVYGQNDEPIGVLHVYLKSSEEKGNLEAFQNVRSKAKDVSSLHKSLD